jgi:hypothetical protein
MKTLWKSMLVGLAATLGVAGWAPQAYATAACGDLNNNGSVNSGDVVLLLKTVTHAIDGSTLCGGSGALQCGDINANGTLSIGDVVVLLNKTVGNPTLFPICTGAPAAIPCGTTITGDVTTTQTWPGGCVTFINGLVKVQQNVVVTIQPGAIIQGKRSPSAGSGGPTNISALIFLRGSKINANGTPTSPIVMTSDAPAGAHAKGDWGGLSIMGAAPVNCPTGECLAEGLVGVAFGGTNPNDSSGVLRYTRVEFSGKELSPDNELNIITYNGVGRGTTVDHVQGNVGFDDCQEWFGGTMNAKYLVASGCGDDMFDQQLGRTGNVQYGLALFYGPNMQNAGNNGFEWDDNENGFNFLPRSNPAFCNMTMIGTTSQPDVGVQATEFGALLRRGTAGRIVNTIFENFRIGGLKLTENETAAVACDSHTTLHTSGDFLAIWNSIFFNNGQGAGGLGNVSGTWTLPCTPTEWYGMLAANNPASDGHDHRIYPTAPGAVGPDPGIPLTYPTNTSDVNQFFPTAGGPAATTVAADCKAIDSFFDTTNYLGAFNPAGNPNDPADNWLRATAGPGGTSWVSFELN